jgi:hypothetical protein
LQEILGGKKTGLKSNKKWLGKGNKWVEKLWTDPYPNRSGLWYSALMPTVLRLGSLPVVIYPNGQTIMGRRTFTSPDKGIEPSSS